LPIFIIPFKSKGELNLPRINGRMEVNMSEVKEDPQVDPAVPTVEGETKEPIEPSIEELKQEIERKETHIQTLQGSLKAAQQRGIPKEELNTLHKKIDDMQEWNAQVMDDLARQISGEEEDTKPVRKTYRQQLQDKREEAKPKEELKLDPDVQKFVKYLDSQGLDSDDPLVKEAVAEDRSPQEALNYLKDKVKGQTQAEVDKLADEKAKNLVELKFKELGLTAPGADGTSAP